jgi:CheY-like chemotaxis protein
VAPRLDTAAGQRNGPRVLVVDDHPTNRLLMARQVQLLGYAAEAADDGEHALSVGCTANAMRSAAEQCLRAGMDDLLIKPAGLAEISQKLEFRVPLRHIEGKVTLPAPLHPSHPKRDATPRVEPGFIEILIVYAHRIKGANLMLGAARMAETCACLESAGAGGQSNALDAPMFVFEAALSQLDQCWQAFESDLSALRPPRRRTTFPASA